MSEAEFVDGVFVKVVETQYGEIIKQSFDCEKFIDFMRANAKQSDKNGRWYFNADILTTKDGGKKYMKVDTFEPQQQQAQAPQQFGTQPQAPQAPLQQNVAPPQYSQPATQQPQAPYQQPAMTQQDNSNQQPF